MLAGGFIEENLNEQVRHDGAAGVGNVTYYDIRPKYC